MTQSLAPYTANGSTATVPYDPAADEPLGSLGLTSDEIRPPYVRFNGRDGQFLFTLDGELSDAIRLVILRKLPDTRLRFNPDATSPDKVLCRSVDMLHPVSSEQAEAIGAGGPDHDSCAACPFAQFGEDRSGKVTKPGCSQILNLAVATDEPLPVPAFFSVKSTALKPVRAVLSQLEILSRVTRRPAFTRIVEFSAGQPVKEGARAYVPLVAHVLNEAVSDEQVDAYAELWKLMRGKAAELIEPEMAAGLEEEQPDSDSGPQFMTPEELQAQLDADEHIVFDEHGVPVETTAATVSEEPMLQHAAVPPASTGGTLPGLDVAERRVDPVDARRGRK